MLQYITDFADQGVVLPVALTLALTLVAQRWWRGAVGWSFAACCLLGSMLVIKLAFASCRAVDFDGIHNPSGHTAVAALLAGGSAALIASDRRSAVITAAIGGLLGALAVGFTRVALGAHSIGDVIAATPVGIGGAIFAARLMGLPPSGLRLWQTLIPALVVAIVMHGTQLPVEQTIRRFAREASPNLPFCQGEPNQLSQEGRIGLHFATSRDYLSISGGILALQ